MLIEEQILLVIKMIFGIVIVFSFIEGWGILISKYLIKNIKSFSLWDNFWIGFAILIFLLQVVHLFLPINLFISYIFVGIGILVLFFHFKKNILNKSWFFLKRKWNLCFLVFIMLIFVSNVFYSDSLGYDFGLYYRQMMNWIQNSSIVLGLANVHGRFGFNNASFLLASLVDNLNIIPQSFRFLTASSYLPLLIRS